MTEHAERILDQRVVFKGRVFSVVERDIQTMPGKTVTWEVIEKHGGDTVGVIAVDDKKNVYLVEEYFGGINQRGLRMPTGKIDEGERSEVTALREMQEEIGLRGKLTELLTVSVSPGYMSQRTVCYLATNLRSRSLKGDEDDHYFSVHKIPLKRAVQMCIAGEISEARTVAALLLVAKKLGE